MSEPRMVRAVKIGTEMYERLPDGNLKLMVDRTNWAAVDAMTEEEINRHAEEDGTLMSDEDWEKVRFIRNPFLPDTVRLDDDILDWFRAEDGSGYQARINDVLRAHMDAASKRS